MYLDIKKIKQQVSMMQLIRYYKIDIRQRKKNAWTGACPIHKGDNKNAFHVNTDKNVFYCFTVCASGGNVIDFVMRMENLSFYKAALWLNKNFIDKTISCQQDISENKAIQYLQDRNLNPRLIQYFDIQYPGQGPFKERISIPIHDEFGNYVSACGRAITKNTTPKYMFLKGFQKSKYLYNIHRVMNSGQDRCIIVEGFFDVFFLTKLGYKAIALMGCSIYPQQIRMLQKVDYTYILMLDGDTAGRKGMIKLEQECKKHAIDFKSIYLPMNIQPENCNVKLLKELLK
jgi:DNA primase